MTSTNEVGSLGDKAAIAAIAQVARSWLLRRTPEATGALVTALAPTGDSVPAMPDWVLHPSESEEDAGRIARLALAVIVEGTDDEASSWAVAATKQASEATAHVLDPISLGVFGAILIGAILAARVKKVGPVEFYEGIPPELADVLKAASGDVSKLG